MPRSRDRILIAGVLAAGGLLRLREALTTYLNPDEVLIALAGQGRSLGFSSATADHPPLFSLVLAAVSVMSASPLALRLPAILAGTMAPWVVYRWVAANWNTRAAGVALLILTFAPNLVSLSAQARGYAPLLLFCALTLILFDRAVRDVSLPRLAACYVVLYMAILTEYSAAWFVGALGLYGLLRLPWRFRGLLALWAAGQLGAVALYVWVWRSAPTIDTGLKATWISTFLRGAFPGPGDRMPVFVAIGTLKQFAYLFGSIPIGVIAMAVFCLGLILVSRRHATDPAAPSYALLVLLVAPFVLAAAGAVLGLHPYGRSRHTVVLSLFISTGVGIGMSGLPWPRGRWVATSGLAGLALWWWVAEPDQNNIAASRARASSLAHAVTFLQATTTTGAIVTDEETSLMLRYALTRLAPLNSEYRNGMVTAKLDGLRLGWRQWTLDDPGSLDADVAELRQRWSLSPDDPVWVADGGFDITMAPKLRSRFGAAGLPDFKSFDDAVIVFRAPGS